MKKVEATFFSRICSFFHFCNSKEGFRTAISGIICIIIGILFGFILMLCFSAQYAGSGLWILLSKGLSDRSLFASSLSSATPMIISGLSIAFAYKLKLFNIGITGQVTFGAFLSVLAGIGGCNWFVCLIIGALGGAAIGFITGYLKAKFNVNEVLSGIMLNWVIYYIIGIIGSLWIPRSFKHSIDLVCLKTMPIAARMPSMGLDDILPNVSVGLIIAIILVIVIFILLNKTNYGFELKMTGLNRDAAKYIGVNQTKAIISTLVISGALAGICGYMLYSTPIQPLKFTWNSGANQLIGDGFTGISVALIAQTSPIGCIFSSLFLTLIDSSAQSLKVISNGVYNIHYVSVIKSSIIYLASLSAFIKVYLSKWYDHNNKIPFFNNGFKLNEDEGRL